MSTCDILSCRCGPAVADGSRIGSWRQQPHPFDYHGALVVVETDVGEIVFIHPPGGPPEAPASLPGNPCH
jgi:hypothetical protein